MWMGVRGQCGHLRGAPQRTSSRVAHRLDAQRVRVEPGRERALLELHVWRAARPRRVARRREVRCGSGRRVAPRDGARPPVDRPPLRPVWRRRRRCRRCRLLRATHLAGQRRRCRRSLLRRGLRPVELVAGRRPSACLALDARRGRCAAVAGTPLQGQQLGEDIGAAERRPSAGRPSLPLSFFWRGHRHVCGGDGGSSSGRGGGGGGGGGSGGRCTSGSTGRGNRRSSARSVRGARGRRTRGVCWRRGRPVARRCGSGGTCGWNCARIALICPRRAPCSSVGAHGRGALAVGCGRRPSVPFVEMDDRRFGLVHLLLLPA